MFYGISFQTHTVEKVSGVIFLVLVFSVAAGF